MRKSIFLGSILVLSVALCLIEVTQPTPIASMKKHIEPILSNYIAHEPILIEDSTNETQFEAMGFSGNGTMDDPYIAEKLSIDGNDASPCIEIRNPHATSGMTSCYFVIRNCYLYNGTDGVLLWDATVGVIEYNVIVINSGSDTAWPIQIVEDYTEGLVYNITIRNNQLTKNHDYNDVLIDISGPGQNVSIMNNIGIGEIMLNVQLNTLVFNNTFLDISAGFNNLPNELSISNNSLRSIYIDTFNPDSTVKIANNSIIGGLKIRNSENCGISGNDIISSTFPVILENADSNIFTNNVFYGLDERYILINTDSASVNNVIDYNFYSDYNGIDENDDNIGDTPYIAGDLGELIDYHPLMSLRGFEIGVPVTSITIPTSSTTSPSTTDTTLPTNHSGTQIPPIMVITLIGGAIGITLVIIVIIVIKKK